MLEANRNKSDVAYQQYYKFIEDSTLCDNLVREIAPNFKEINDIVGSPLSYSFYWLQIRGFSSELQEVNYDI